MKKVSSIQRKILETIQKIESLKVVESHVDEVKDQLSDAYNKLKSIDSKVQAELEDVVKLEKLTVKSLFYKTLGSKEQQLEKERQEYLEVLLKYKEYNKSIELMAYELALLEKKLTSLPSLKNDLKVLKKQRKEEIIKSDDSMLKRELNAVLKKLELHAALSVELNEAYNEGQKSLKTIQVVMDHLKKARQWGNWRGHQNKRRASILKHQAIDKAMKHLHVAQHHLNLFSRELKDLGENNIEFSLNMDHFGKFTDFFFDNLISDWIVQQRIKATLGNLESTKSHISRILMNLMKEVEQNKSRVMALEKQKDNILTS